MAEGMAGVGDLMPVQVYHCPKHGDSERLVAIEDDVPAFVYCQVREENPEGGALRQCFRRCNWVPPTVSFPGGPTTGARPPEVKE